MNNPSYTKYEHSERHAIIDEAIENSLEALRTPEVSQLLGARALLLARDLQRTTIPNIKHGVITPNAENHLIEVVALHHDEEVYRHYSSAGFNSIQIANLMDIMPEEIAGQIIKDQNHHYNKDKLLHIKSFHSMPGVAAYVLSNRLSPKTEQDTPLTLKGRPLVVLSADKAADRQPSIIAHEFTHVDQINNSPVANPYIPKKVAHAEAELEAFHVGAQVIRGQVKSRVLPSHSSRVISQRTIAIDELRQQYQPRKKGPFKLSKVLMRALERNNLNLEITPVTDQYAND